MNIFMNMKIFNIMKSHLSKRDSKHNKRCLGIITVTAVLFALCSATAWSIENGAISNPISSSTVPPSSSGIGSSLIQIPDPIDTSGNLVITGNIRRGRHFRDTVPYRSTTSFSGGLGSASLESFLRGSAGAEDFGFYSGKYSSQPYYSPTQTVATTRPGRSGVFGPTGTMISPSGAGAQDVFGPEPLPEKQAMSGWETSAPDVGTQTMLLSQQEIERLVRSEVGIHPRGEKLIPAEGISRSYQTRKDAFGDSRQYEYQMELLRRSIQQMKDETARLQESLIEQDEPSILSRQVELSERIRPTEGAFELQAPLETLQSAKERKKGRFLTGQAPKERTKDALDHRFSKDFASLKDLASQEDPILWGPQMESAAFEEPLQKIAQSELEPKANEEITGLGEREKGRLGGLTPLRTQEQIDELSTNATQRIWGPDIYEQVKEQIDNLVKREAESTKQDARQRTEDRGQRTEMRNLTSVNLPFETLREMSAQENSRTRRFASQSEAAGALDRLANVKKRVWNLDELDELSQTDLSAKAKRIMGPYRSLESFSQEKFNQHIRAAQHYLRQGRYYRAADSFALASIYKAAPPPVCFAKPKQRGSDAVQAFDMALCLAGRSHALFAAGEYMSSALFLSRALEIAPEYLQTKIDLATMLGGSDKVESRIADVKEWLGRSGAAELHFLLGYVYYRMGRGQLAKQAIDAAHEKMPDRPKAGTIQSRASPWSLWPAVSAVKKAIDDAIGLRNPN